LVEANWNASAATAEAPFENSDLAIAIAAYEQLDDAAPRPVAKATGFVPEYVQNSGHRTSSSRVRLRPN
jgi:hypothetical protein